MEVRFSLPYTRNPPQDVGKVIHICILSEDVFILALSIHTFF